MFLCTRSRTARTIGGAARKQQQDDNEAYSTVSDLSTDSDAEDVSKFAVAVIPRFKIAAPLSSSTSPSPVKSEQKKKSGNKKKKSKQCL